MRGQPASASAPRSRRRGSGTSRASPAPSEAADARVAALELLHDEAVGDRRRARRSRSRSATPRAPERAELRDSSCGKVPGGSACRSTGITRVVDEAAEGVAHQPLVVGEELVEGVVVERGVGHRRAIYDENCAESTVPLYSNWCASSRSCWWSPPRRHRRRRSTRNLTPNRPRPRSSATRSARTTAATWRPRKKLVSELADDAVVNRDYLAWLRGMVALRTGRCRGRASARSRRSASCTARASRAQVPWRLADCSWAMGDPIAAAAAYGKLIKSARTPRMPATSAPRCSGSPRRRTTADRVPRARDRTPVASARRARRAEDARSSAARRSPPPSGSIARSS